jgi:hypothetical protein
MGWCAAVEPQTIDIKVARRVVPTIAIASEPIEHDRIA